MPPLAILDAWPWTSSEVRQRLIHSINSSPPPKESPTKRKTLIELAENAEAKDADEVMIKKSRDSVKEASEDP